MAGETLIPRLDWLAQYGAGKAVRDAIAGLILAVLLVPQAMAYAQLAGLPPQVGLFAALAPPLLYLLFGTSKFVSLGPVALVSLIVAEAASGASAQEQMAATMIVAIEAGIMLVALGALRLGRLVNFVSEPALLGFTAAAAVLIALSQLPTLLGLDVDRAGNAIGAVEQILPALPATVPDAAIIGGAALVLLLFINRYAAALLWKAGLHPPIRQAVAKSLPLLVVVGAAVLVANVAPIVPTVAAISGGLPHPSLPEASLQLWLELLPSSVAVAVIIFVTATAVAKSLAGDDRSHLDTSREAVALGAGNIAAAMTGGYAVGASLSRSALVEDSGAASPIASVVASLAVLAVLLVLAPLLSYLPKTALAALVISAVFGLVKLREIGSVWRHDRLEGWIVAVTFVATLLLGVRLGLAVGAGLGIAHYLWFSSVPRISRIGTDDGGLSFRSVDHDGVEIEALPVLIMRIDRSLYFANAAFCEDAIFEQLSQHDDMECVILDMRAVNGIDASGIAMLRRVTQRMKMMHIAVHFAAAHQPIEDKLGSLDTTVCRFHRTVGEAVDACGVSFDEAEGSAEKVGEAS